MRYMVLNYFLAAHRPYGSTIADWLCTYYTRFSYHLWLCAYYTWFTRHTWLYIGLWVHITRLVIHCYIGSQLKYGYAHITWFSLWLRLRSFWSVLTLHLAAHTMHYVWFSPICWLRTCYIVLKLFLALHFYVGSHYAWGFANTFRFSLTIQLHT